MTMAFKTHGPSVRGRRVSARTALPLPSSQVVDHAAVSAILERITASCYIPGTRLTFRELSASTGYEPAVLRPALDHLTTTGAVEGRWLVADPRPEQRMERTRNLLAGMIDRGAWPGGTTLPARTVLVRMLLAEPAHITVAYAHLAGRGVLRLTSQGPTPVLPAPDGSPARAPWPAAENDVLNALPARTHTGAGHDQDALPHLCYQARQQWKSGVTLPDPAMTQQEKRQAETVHHLIIRAVELTSGRPPTFLPALRSAAARVMACHALPTTGPLHDRLYRFTTLATALAHLADALAAPGTGPDRRASAPFAHPLHASEGS